MKTIQLNQRTARLLRDNLTQSQEGYDYVDLLRLDRLAKRLTELQGSYADEIAELARVERKIRRRAIKGEITQPEAQRALLEIQVQVDELNEDAVTVPVSLDLEDADWKLVTDKVDAVGKWVAGDEIRSLIIEMVEAIRSAGAAAAGPSETPAANGHERRGKLAELKRG